MSLSLASAARCAGRRGASGLSFRLQRPHIPSRAYPATLAKRTNFSTSAFRRQNASNTATTAPSPAKPATPPAFWERLGPVSAFFRFYGKSQASRPYLTQFVSSLFIFATGDLAAQYLGGEEYDLNRTLRILAISAGSSIIIFRWFLVIAKNFNYSSKLLSLVTKVTVNQVVYAPVFGTYYFAMQSFLSGDNSAQIWDRVKTAMPVSVKSSWMFWPPITAATFAFVPPTYHAVLLACVTTGWQAYLSFLNRKTETDSDTVREGVIAAAKA